VTTLTRPFRWLWKLAKSAYKAVRGCVYQLRASAIEPLPHVDRMPVPLRRLQWENKPTGQVDAAATVRRLRGRPCTPEEQNELGCAYALLAWEPRLDQYWVLAIEELRAVADDSPVGKRAGKNLEYVAAASGLPVDA
jgi:hypothetical protein